MRGRLTAFGRGAVLLVCLAVAGCASTGAPEGWLPTAAEAPRDPYGAWIQVEFERPYRDRKLKGEFLAVDADSLYVLMGVVEVPDPIASVPLDLVRKARIAYFDPETGRVGGWVALGAVSTISHGVAAAISMPIWIIAGSGMAATQSRTPLASYPDLAWEDLRVYARFPQGPPPRLRQLGLQPKSVDYVAPPPTHPF